MKSRIPMASDPFYSLFCILILVHQPWRLSSLILQKWNIAYFRVVAKVDLHRGLLGAGMVDHRKTLNAPGEHAECFRWWGALPFREWLWARRGRCWESPPRLRSRVSVLSFCGLLGWLSNGRVGADHFAVQTWAPFTVRCDTPDNGDVYS